MEAILVYIKSSSCVCGSHVHMIATVSPSPVFVFDGGQGLSFASFMKFNSIFKYKIQGR
jgi:hypothetical protein